jgi:hypothetical protein
VRTSEERLQNAAHADRLGQLAHGFGLDMPAWLKWSGL